MRPILKTPKRNYLSFQQQESPINSEQENNARIEYGTKINAIYKPHYTNLSYSSEFQRNLSDSLPRRESEKYRETGKNAIAFLDKYPIFNLDKLDRYLEKNDTKLRELFKKPFVGVRYNFIKQVELIHQSSSMEGNQLPLGSSITLCKLLKENEENYFPRVEDLFPQISSSEYTNLRDIRNHFLALKYALSLDASWNIEAIHQLHRQLFIGSSNEKCDIWGKTVTSGQYRHLPSRPYGFSTVYAFPLEIPYLMKELIQWKNKYLFDKYLPHQRLMVASKFLLNFLQIHPYFRILSVAENLTTIPLGSFNRNGRIGRLLFAIILEHNGINPLIFYQKTGITRKMYLDALSKGQNGEEEEWYNLIYLASK
jgi:hypothetical protein